MDSEIGFDFPCASVTVDSIIRFGVAGCGWGFFTGQYEANRNGMAGRSRASFVIKSVGKYGLQCGLFAGMFSATRCGIQRYRMEKDWVNASVAGAVTGAALAARTRNWTQIFGSAILQVREGLAIDVKEELPPPHYLFWPMSSFCAQGSSLLCLDIGWCQLWRVPVRGNQNRC
ncbi:hypothetical protein H6P81_015153 [Aristolochia fimbriata]|uniref:Uncharacterized protein n=1 Tax=Aristolochia fimbriata TaxID=158543 RepID=A0AAV7E4P6_ARIFI|nr:hypothetical protein H6P81_015153 [Aristolochia fimbriata]